MYEVIKNFVRSYVRITKESMIPQVSLTVIHNTLMYDSRLAFYTGTGSLAPTFVQCESSESFYYYHDSPSHCILPVNVKVTKENAQVHQCH